ncbi:serine hydrolase [Pontixanthobacter sp.]|uniref:serine hydrolase n=1 Tax=Pontixanthobacter sp. TaxID=2792078 RepID=UPI003C7B8F2F
MITRIMLAVMAMSLTVMAVPGSAFAQEAEDSIFASRADDVAAVLQGAKTAENVFDDAFLTQVPPAQLAQLTASLTAQFGALIGVEQVEPAGPYGGKVVFRFERALGVSSMTIQSSAPHRVTGLLIQTFDPIEDSLAKISTDLDALPGDVSVFFAPLDQTARPFVARDAQTLYAIGSTFKLYILSALARSIEAGERQWSDVAVLDRRSLPSGQMQNWPVNAPVTLHTLATMMISISDNTATDILLHELGRDAVERELIASGHSDPDRTLPFLSTLELFALKGSPANAAEYLAADQSSKRRILADFEDAVKGDPGAITPPRFTEPTAIDTLEWFASGRDLRRLLRRIVALDDPTARDILTVTKSLPQMRIDEWDYVGYKGGSEPGVFNLTWLLRDKGGEWHVLTLSWNNKQEDVDKTALSLLASRMIALAS